MSRIRSIKPEFWTSAQVMECSTNARLMFIGLWNFCDDAGRHVDNAKQIKAQIFPSDDFSSENVRGMIEELIANGLVTRYEAGGATLLQVNGWHHQRIDKPQKPRYPGPEEPKPESIPGTFQERSRLIRYDTIGREGIGEDPPLPPESFRELKLTGSTTNGHVDLHAEILSAYHELLPALPRVKDWSDRRRKKLDARIRERKADGKPADSPTYWRSVFEKAARSDLLCGRKTEWRADLEWMLEPKHFTKLIEGGYDNVARLSA